jgi:hypothetical protein
MTDPATVFRFSKLEREWSNTAGMPIMRSRVLALFEYIEVRSNRRRRHRWEC